MKTFTIQGVEYTATSIKFWEYCQHCEKEVLLSTEYKIQECPHCKRLIKPCSLCDMDLVDCTKCEIKKRRKYL